jgi:penicillin-binding protein 1C
MWRKLYIFLSILAVLLLGFVLATYLAIKPITQSLHAIVAEAQNLPVTDRNGYPLSVSYQNRWNTYDNLPLYQIPDFLKQAFVLSEDQHFYQHRGIDWQARFSAIWQNMRAHHTVRGASTISEQVVRMIHPRPRTLWSKWLETLEAMQLEQQTKKADILEFYLNQLPYAANRRGVLQAARYYFDRDVATLDHQEMLALVVLARAPSSFDLYKNAEKITGSMLRLATALNQQGILSAKELAEMPRQKLSLNSPKLPSNAAHFISFVRDQLSAQFSYIAPHAAGGQFRTTLDANLQQKIQDLTDERVKSLATKGVHNAAVVVADHITGEILAWVVAGANSGSSDHPVPGYQIDAVTVPRQPGSALKPFLYTLALESGWSPATLIDDSPLSAAIGTGLHHFKNYSNTYYGPISLREALGNSLNIPALRTIQFVGVQRYLNTLHALHFNSLTRKAAIYDEGLALGNGEVTLLELVTAYTALANQGVYRPLHFLLNTQSIAAPRRIFSAEASSLIGNILSDAWARRLEFGTNSVMNMPVQTAVKTGTSTDYRDAWVVGFNYRYVVGIWMGNLDQAPMYEMTGSLGPTLVMRSIFSLLNQHQKTAPLYLSRKLVRKDICAYQEADACLMRTEYFIAGTEIEKQKMPLQPAHIEWVQPTAGLQVAIDPRIPRDKQKLAFQIVGTQPGDSVDWLLNGKNLAHTQSNQYLWMLERGEQVLNARVNRDGKLYQQLPPVKFAVK